ncbi:MAG: hypothetical protein AAB225_12610 [Acidobacteriota bacterium]
MSIIDLLCASSIDPAGPQSWNLSTSPMLKNWLECIHTRQRTIANHAFRTGSRVTRDNKWNLPGWPQRGAE